MQGLRVDNPAPAADLDAALTLQHGTAKSEARVARAAAALEANGISVRRAADAGQAREMVLAMIPEGAAVHQGSSQTLEVTGITAAIEGLGRFQAIRSRIRNMDRTTQADDIRRLAAAPDVMLGSVQAVTETGSLIAASYLGSQLGAHAFGAGRVILVVGAQKIVANLDEGMRRITEYAFPLESARTQAVYRTASAVNKVLIVHREVVADRITVVLVSEAVGF